MEALLALAADWFVELSTTNEPGVWSLVVTKRVGGYAALRFSGDLADVIERALRGSAPDSVSR